MQNRSQQNSEESFCPKEHLKVVFNKLHQLRKVRKHTKCLQTDL